MEKRIKDFLSREVKALIAMDIPERVYCHFPGNKSIWVYFGDEGLSSYLSLSDQIPHSPAHIKHSFLTAALEVIVEENQVQCYEYVPGCAPQLFVDDPLLARIFEPLSNYFLIHPDIWEPQKSFYLINGELHPFTLPRPLKSGLLSYENELKIHRLKKISHRNHQWEAVQFFVLPKIWSRERDCEIIPLATIVVDENEECIYFEDFSAYSQKSLEVCEKLADYCLKCGKLPRKLLVEDEITHASFQDFCKKIGISCEIKVDNKAVRLRDRLMGISHG